MTGSDSNGNAWSGRARHLVFGGALSLVVVLAAATLSAWPVWQSLAPDLAVVRLSFTLSGARNCRNRTAEELSRLPANMRQNQICDRRRAPVRIEMDVDGRPVLAADLPPSGLAGSGPSRVYHRVEVHAGRVGLEVRMRDDPATQDFTHRAQFVIDLAPGQSAAVDFDASTGRFFLH